MIQELLGGAGLEGLPCPSPSPSPSPSPTPSPSPSPSSSTTATPTTSSDNQNQNQNQNQLRCPRCDSSNTKFCYYNNYNLTQPRHFCKTCRRYWTKGGALRNVPIGGGCRKNKSAVVTASVSKSSTGRLKLLSPEFGKSGLLTGLEQDLPSNPLMWGSPHNSHLLALLRATHNPNPNPNYNPNAISASVSVKEEAGPMIGAHMSTDYGVAGGVLNGTRTALGFDPLGQVPSIGLCSSFWRNNQHQPHHQNSQSQSQSQSQAHQNGIAHEVVQNTGIQELYQRLRSSSTYNYYPDHSPLVLGNVAPSSSSPSSAILESAPLAGTELGYWAPTLSWSDHLPTTNGAYP